MKVSAGMGGLPAIAKEEPDRITFREMLVAMEKDDSHCQVDYAELERQKQSWPKCSICGSPFVGSRSTKDGVCGDAIKHAQQQDTVRIQNVPRCAHCSRIIPDVHQRTRRKVRNDRKYCSDSCKTLSSKHRKERSQPVNREFTDIAEGGLTE